MGKKMGSFTGPEPIASTGIKQDPEKESKKGEVYPIVYFHRPKKSKLGQAINLTHRSQTESGSQTSGHFSGGDFAIMVPV